MSTGYGWEGIRQVCATLLGARHVPERLCGGVCLQRGAITSVRPLPLTHMWYQLTVVGFVLRLNGLCAPPHSVYSNSPFSWRQTRWRQVRETTSWFRKAADMFCLHRMKVAHLNLCALLSHLQGVTVDNQANITRLDRGLRIRRPKTQRSLMNDACIKTCINHYDSGAYSPMQFLDTMSHNMDAHAAALNLGRDSDDDDDGADEDEAQTTDQTPPQDAAVTSEPASRASGDCYEVCLINGKDPRIALAPCGHQRFCESSYCVYCFSYFTPLLHCLPLPHGAALSSPANSIPATWYRIVHSCIFHTPVFDRAALSTPANSINPD